MINYKDKYKEKYKKILFIPGWGVTNEIWETFASELFYIDRCVFIDIYEEVKVLDGDINLIAKKVINEHKNIDLIISWSLGCFLAKEIESLSSSNVRKMIYIAYTPRFLKTPSWDFGFNKNAIDKLRYDLEKDQEKALKNFYLLILGSYKHKKIFYKEIIKNIKSMMKIDLEKLNMTLDLLENHICKTSFKKKQNNNLYIYGEEDAITSSDIANFIDENESFSNIVTIPKSSHAPFLTNKKEFKKILIENI